MSTRRVTQVLTQVEYTTPTDFRRTTQVLAQVEYLVVTDYRRVTQILVQVEYSKSYAMARYAGPTLQEGG